MTPSIKDELQKAFEERFGPSLGNKTVEEYYNLALWAAKWMAEKFKSEINKCPISGFGPMPEEAISAYSKGIEDTKSNLSWLADQLAKGLE